MSNHDLPHRDIADGDMRHHLDEAIILSGDEVQDAYAKDWSEAAAHLPEIVLRPRTIDEISQILTLAQSHGQRIVTQGGRTGLAGGATPQQSEWVLSVERLNKIIALDPIGQTITVEAGVTLQQIQEAASAHNLMFPLDLGARGTATAGGITATNAGGNQVIHYGVTRQLVLGMSAVMADGTVMRQDNHLLKNNAGFDLKQLLIGTEGVLGVIGTVTFRLFPKRDITKTALCAVTSFDDVTKLLFQVSKSLIGLTSFEVLWEDYLSEITAVTEKPPLFDGRAPFVVLIEVEAATDTGDVEACLMAAVETGLIIDAMIAQNDSQRAQFWSYRDAIAELLTEMAPNVNFDIGVPITKMGAFTSDVTKALKQKFPTIRLVTFGHIGDGNLHISCTTGHTQDQVPIEDLVFAKATQMGGTITAEHGIGILKKPWLKDCRAADDIMLMKRLKAMFDPADILNKGRVI